MEQPEIYDFENSGVSSGFVIHNEPYEDTCFPVFGFIINSLGGLNYLYYRIMNYIWCIHNFLISRKNI